jgi:hypothetical protein
MNRERAKTFADRLPTVVPREETDISHLSDEMADLLYPGRRPRPFRMGVRFEDFAGTAGEEAAALARRGAYRERREHGRLVHETGFDAASAADLRRLWELVGSRPGTEALVDGRRAPYASTLWLPLFFVFVGGDPGPGA